MAKRIALVVALALAVMAPVAPEARAASRITRTQWISTGDPLTTMHADVVRSANAGWTTKQPVILVATPYGNHSGQTDPWPLNSPAPSTRFDDFLSLSAALVRGYTYVIVDLPGYGGSSGCSDLGGPLERGAVKRAVEWAATQTWSNGKVALFGKSYDGWTGLMGVAERPAGLAAVVAMEPVYSPYTVDFAHGVRNTRSFLLPGVYAAIDANPGVVGDSPQYQANSVIRPQCYAWTQANWLNDDEAAAFWRERDLPADSLGSPVPLFMTQGLLETNTVSRGSVDYFNSLSFAGNRAWFGQFGHVRGWEYDAGRTGFVSEVMDFLELHLKNKGSGPAAPRISVQDNFGRYRGEDAFPPADSQPFPTQLTTGEFVDEDLVSSLVDNELWSVSAPLAHDVWMSGEPRITLTVDSSSPRANLGARLFDVDADGDAVEVSRDAYMARAIGSQQVEFALMAQDWVFEAGHRIAVEVGPPTRGWFNPVPSGGKVKVTSSRIALPFLTAGRTQFIGGWVSSFLASQKANTTRLPETAALVPFAVPGPISTGAR